MGCHVVCFFSRQPDAEDTLEGSCFPLANQSPPWPFQLSHQRGQGNTDTSLWLSLDMQDPRYPLPSVMHVYF